MLPEDKNSSQNHKKMIIDTTNYLIMWLNFMLTEGRISTTIITCDIILGTNIESYNTYHLTSGAWLQLQEEPNFNNFPETHKQEAI